MEERVGAVWHRFITRMAERRYAACRVELPQVAHSLGILFRYQDWDPRKQEYSKDKYSIRRYQKRGGEYRQQSKFNISSPDQARQLIDTLNKWLAD